MRAFVLSVIFFLAVINGINGRPNESEKKQICEPGARTKVDCNTCTCSRDGTALGCTRMACVQIPAEYLNPDGSLRLPHHENPLLRTRRETTCEPGTVREVDCNTCRCSPDGTDEDCTRMACPSPLRKRRETSTTCEPGSSWKEDCNNCFCSSDGRHAACTLMLCLH